MEDKNEYITLTNLKNRGWTNSIIKKMDLQADKQAQNPYYKKAAPVKLFLVDRIEDLENSEQFIALITKSKPRKEAAKNAVDTKIVNLFAYIENVPVIVEYVSEPELTYYAISAYNNWQCNRPSVVNGNNDGNHANINSDKAFLARIRTNYIRHNLTNYDSILAKIGGKVGISEVYPELKKRVMARIDAESTSHAKAMSL